MSELITEYQSQLNLGVAKSEIAKNMAKSHPEFTRQEFLQLLMGSLSMKETQANTYYYKYIKVNSSKDDTKLNLSIEKNISIASVKTPGEHLDFLFKNILSSKDESWAGYNIRSYAQSLKNLGLQIDIEDFPDKALSRREVFEFVTNCSNTLFNSCIVICAWGGMNRKHCYSAFNNWLSWKAVADDILSGNSTRGGAYEAFASLRKNNQLPGMGPAYYTKLIYFLSQPQNRGYIMDQWTARSYNLLHGNHDILMNKQIKKSGELQAHVSDKNTSSAYEKFCYFIEKTADSLGEAVSADDVELSMFSEGRGKGVWRSYLKAQDKHIYQ